MSYGTTQLENEKIALSYLVFIASDPTVFVFSDEDDFCSQPMADRLLVDEPPTACRPVALLIVLDLVMPLVFGDVGALAPFSDVLFPEAVVGLDGVWPLLC